MKILLAEDVRSIAAAMVARLSAIGHEVSVAENGRVAFHKFRASPYDIILMDIEMPEMNGFEATTEIRSFEATQKWAWTPIIFLTSSNSPENLVTAIEAGGDDFMVKGLPEPILHAKMKALARIANMRQRLSIANTELNEAYKAAENAHQQTAKALDDLRCAQSQLIQAEKMAALGHLVTSVAHEINTPIGAVKSSGKSIADALDDTLKNMPQLFNKLDAPLRHRFIELINHAKRSNSELSTREGRAMTLEVTRKLEAAHIEDARRKAGLLVKLNAKSFLEETLPLLRHAECDLILDTAQGIASIIGSTRNINTAVERVSRIVFALRAFSSADENGEMIDVNLQQSMDAVLREYQSQMLQGSKVVRQYEEIPPLWCIREDMQQVLSHLIHNALQAMGYQGTLTVGLRRLGDEAVVTVSDTGCGIAFENRDKIFDAFFTTRSSGEGCGLGLAIVKKIVDKHQGRIAFQSEPGVGTTFSIHLPYPKTTS